MNVPVSAGGTYVGTVGAAVGVGVAAYGGLAACFRATEMRELWAGLKR